MAHQTRDGPRPVPHRPVSMPRMAASVAVTFAPNRPSALAWLKTVFPSRAMQRSDAPFLTTNSFCRWGGAVGFEPIPLRKPSGAVQVLVDVPYQMPIVMGNRQIPSDARGTLRR